MIKLECNKCGKEIVWTLVLGKLPDGWMEYEGKDLCEGCTKKFNEFKKGLDELMASKVKEYFD